MDRQRYWLNLYTWKTWNEFRKAGGELTGFRKSRWKTAQRIKPGDQFICYLTGVSRWIGLEEVTGPAYLDDTPSAIWEDDPFPVRIPIKLLVGLDAEIAVPIMELKERLSIFKNLKNPHAWTGKLRGSPVQWDFNDGEVIAAALRDAQSNPVKRAVDPTKLKKVPSILKTRTGEAVTVPDAEDKSNEHVDATQPDSEKTPYAHTEVQWLLLKLGNDMGLDVWVAKNDRNREFKGQKFSDLTKMITKLPVQFDDATQRTVELIDVLWLKGQTIVGAFEIESTTSIYSGLLRMSDLISMQPNLAMPHYIVAPDDRRDKVITEINRPTFSKLVTPLSEICRYIPFSALKQSIEKAGPLIKHLNPEFLDDFAEVCDAGEV